MSSTDEPYSPELEYCHPSTISDEVRQRRRHRIKRFLKVTVVMLLCSCIIACTVVGIWWWVYGKARAASTDHARVQLRAILGHLEPEVQVETTAHLRRYDDPDTYYYKLVVDPSKAEEFTDKLLSSWTRHSGNHTNSAANLPAGKKDPDWWAGWQDEPMRFYDLTSEPSARMYVVGYSTSTGEIWLLENRFESPDPIAPNLENDKHDLGDGQELTTQPVG